MVKTIKVASLFSGIGGFEIGLKKSHLHTEVVFASEIDKFAQKSYKTIFEQQPEGDITKIHEFLVPNHDLLVAGFPCQAFSVAGKRKGFEDTRGTLFFDIARILDWKRPKVVLLENVKNLITHNNTETLRTILTVLSDIGYSVDFEVLNSKYFNVPQNRERTYIVGVLNGPTEPWLINSEIPRVNDVKTKINNQNDDIQSFNFNFKSVEVKSNVSLESILEDHVPEHFFLRDSIVDKLLDTNKHKDFEVKNEIIKVLDIPKELHNDNERQRRVYSPKGISPTVLARTDSAKILVNDKNRKRIRKLTPIESFRLQGFSDELFYKLVDEGLSNTQLYKQAGNAVTTTVIKSIANNMYKYLITEEIEEKGEILV